MSEKKTVGQSEKHERGRRRVPDALQSVFDELVEDYKFSGLKHYGAPFVSYEILADLVLGGWRPAATPRSRSNEEEGES